MSNISKIQVGDTTYDIKDAEAERIVIKNASGAIASFDDGIEVPAAQVKVNIEPVQEGEGDPSLDNIRSITGWTGATVTRAGKNLLPIRQISANYNGVNISTNADGSFSAVGTATSNLYAVLFGGFYSKRIPIPEWLEVGKQYYISSGITGSDQNKRIEVDFYDEAGNTNTFYDSSFTVLDTYKYIGIFIRITTSANAVDLIFHPQIELGSTATDYEPYQSDTYSITFPTEAGIVYGELDVTSGKLTVDRKLITIDGINNKIYFSSNQNNPLGKVVVVRFRDTDIDISKTIISDKCIYVDKAAANLNINEFRTFNASNNNYFHFII